MQPRFAPYCTVKTMVWLLTTWPVALLVVVAVILVVPAATLVARPLPLGRPVLMVATFVFDEVQVTAWVTSLLELPLA